MFLHRRERNIFRIAILSLILTLCVWKVEQVYDLYFRLPELAMIVSLLAIIGYDRMTKTKMRNWRAEGNQITESLRLNSLLLFPSDLLKSPEVEFELHLRQNTVKEGFELSKNSRKDNLIELKANFKDDFEKIFEWAVEQRLNGSEILIHTTTHESLAHLWKEAASHKFDFEETIKKFDPYVEMNYLQWIIASFCTTGTVKWRKPIHWNSYVLTVNEIKRE